MYYIVFFLILIIKISLISSMEKESVEAIAHRARCQANIYCHSGAQRSLQEIISHSDSIADSQMPDQKSRSLSVTDQSSVICTLRNTTHITRCDNEEFQRKKQNLEHFIHNLRNANTLFSDALDIYMRHLSMHESVYPSLFAEHQKEKGILQELFHALNKVDRSMNGKFLTTQQRQIHFSHVELLAKNLQLKYKHIMALELAMRLCQMESQCNTPMRVVIKSRMQAFENWALKKVNSEKNNTLKGFYEK